MRKIICLFCKSPKVVKRGKRYNDSGEKQLYMCKKCKRKFTPGRRRLRFGEKDIMRAVGMKRKGMSLSEVQKEMKKHGVEVSRWSISLWEKKFR